MSCRRDCDCGPCLDVRAATGALPIGSPGLWDIENPEFVEPLSKGARDVMRTAGDAQVGWKVPRWAMWGGLALIVYYTTVGGPQPR